MASATEIGATRRERAERYASREGAHAHSVFTLLLLLTNQFLIYPLNHIVLVVLSCVFVPPLSSRQPGHAGNQGNRSPETKGGSVCKIPLSPVYVRILFLLDGVNAPAVGTKWCKIL